MSAPYLHTSLVCGTRADYSSDIPVFVSYAGTESGVASAVRVNSS